MIAGDFQGVANGLDNIDLQFVRLADSLIPTLTVPYTITLGTFDPDTALVNYDALANTGWWTGQVTFAQGQNVVHVGLTPQQSYFPGGAAFFDVQLDAPAAGDPYFVPAQRFWLASKETRSYGDVRVTIYESTRLFASSNESAGLADPISLGDGPDFGVDINDIMQGGQGDCAFLAVVGALAKNDPQFIHNMFQDNGNGTATVRFYPTEPNPSGGFRLSGAAPVPVTISLSLDAGYSQAHLSGDYDLSSDGTFREWEIWPQMLEKAYTQFIGQTIKDVYAYVVWMQFTGGSASDVLTWNGTAPTMTAEAISNQLNNLIASGSNIVISSRASGVVSVDGLNYEVVANHGYTLLSISNGIMELFNPWGGDSERPGDGTGGSRRWPVIYVPLNSFITYFRRYQYQAPVI